MLSRRTDLPPGDKLLEITAAPSPALTLSAGTDEDHRTVTLDWEEGGFLDRIASLEKVGFMEPPAPGETEPYIYFATIMFSAPGTGTGQPF